MSGCSHGMGAPASCIDCMDEGNLPVPKQPKPTTEFVFTAAYAGECSASSCSVGIEVGDRIASVQLSPSTVVYMHARCAP